MLAGFVYRVYLCTVYVRVYTTVISNGGFIKEEYYSWVQYKSGPGGETVDVKRVLLTI